MIAGIIIVAGFVGWCTVSSCNYYESSPAGKGTAIKHQIVETCKGAEYTVEDIIKASLDDPDSFDRRDRHSTPSSHDLVIGDIGPDQTATFVAHFRRLNRYGAYELDQRRGYFDVSGCAVYLFRDR